MRWLLACELCGLVSLGEVIGRRLIAPLSRTTVLKPYFYLEDANKECVSTYRKVATHSNFSGMGGGVGKTPSIVKNHRPILCMH